MKHLKSTTADLQVIVEHALVARLLAEPLASFDENQNTGTVREFMNHKEYDVVGVRRDGLVIGYAKKSDLCHPNELVRSCVRKFDDERLSESRGIMEVLETLRKINPLPVFVVGQSDHVWGIVTRGDLHKAPVRMYLFSVISLLEMQFVRLIRNYHPREEWRHWLNGRLQHAEKTLEERRRRNEHIDLVDCLQWADKKKIIEKSDLLRKQLDFESKTKAECFLSQLEGLRNPLAHGQDVLAGRWPDIVDLIDDAEKLLSCCERA